MSKMLILAFNLFKGTDAHCINGVKQLAEEGGQYYARRVPYKDPQWGPTPWEPISAIEAEAIRREYDIVRGMRGARQPEALNAPKHSKGDDTSVNHLGMAIETLRNMSDGDGPEDHLFAISLGLVALAERVDLMVGLAMRFTAIMEDAVAGLERQRWATLSPDAREVELWAEGLIP